MQSLALMIVHEMWLRFETEIRVPADTQADAVAIKDYFPSLLVA
jgi:hypothetical protein